MSVQKPTTEELRAWDKVLQKEKLGMDRGYNSTRLIYGHDFERTNDGTKSEDAAVWIRKTGNAKQEKKCVECGALFQGRRDALCCSWRCHKRKQRKVSKIVATIYER